MLTSDSSRKQVERKVKGNKAKYRSSLTPPKFQQFILFPCHLSRKPNPHLLRLKDVFRLPYQTIPLKIGHEESIVCFDKNVSKDLNFQNPRQRHELAVD